MRPRTELGLAAGLLLVLGVGRRSLVGSRRTRPAPTSRPARPTSPGPAAPARFAEALERLGVEVERFRRPTAALAMPDSSGEGEVVAVLGPADSAQRGRGAHLLGLPVDLLLAGDNSASAIRCLGYQVVAPEVDRPGGNQGAAGRGRPSGASGLGRAGAAPGAADRGLRRLRRAEGDLRRAGADPGRHAAPDGARPAGGGPAAVLRRPGGDARGRRPRSSGTARCGTRRPVRSCSGSWRRATAGWWWTSTTTAIRRPARWAAPRSAGAPARPGDGRAGSSPPSACSRCSRRGCGSARCGRAIERRRRSPMEHVRALATALAAARGHDVAVRLMIQGLRRRLSRGAAAPTRGDLESLARRARPRGPDRARADGARHRSPP